MTVTSLSAFNGDWTLERCILDRSAGRDGALNGQARFIRDGDIWIYKETGVLIWPDTPPMQAQRGYRFVENSEGVAVFFENGDAFHEFKWNNPSAKHDCAPDTYLVSYDFTRWPVWKSTWNVTGPRKNYTMHSTYTRP